MRERRGLKTLWVALVRPAEAPSAALRLWAGLAAVSLGAAAYLSLQQGRSVDLWEVRDWLRGAAGVSPYQLPNLVVDYPPHGLLLLAPMGWLPLTWLPHTVTLVNLVSCVVAAWLCVRVSAELAGLRLSPQRMAIYTAMIASWGAFRSTVYLGQTNAGAVAAVMLALLWFERRPWLAGVALALASYKINLVVGVVVALTILRAWVTLATAAAAVIALTTAYAVGIGVPMARLLRDYTSALLAHYSGPDFHDGMTDVRSIVHAIVGDHWAAERIYAAVVAVGLAFLLWLGTRHVARHPGSRLAVVAAALLWGLASVFNLPYNVVLAAPAFLFLVWPETSPIRSLRVRDWLTFALILRFVVTVFVLGKLAAQRGWLPEVFVNVWFFGTRVVVLCLFVYLLGLMPRSVSTSFPRAT